MLRCRFRRLCNARPLDALEVTRRSRPVGGPLGAPLGPLGAVAAWSSPVNAGTPHYSRLSCPPESGSHGLWSAGSSAFSEFTPWVVTAEPLNQRVHDLASTDVRDALHGSPSWLASSIALVWVVCWSLTEIHGDVRSAAQAMAGTARHAMRPCRWRTGTLISPPPAVHMTKRHRQTV